MKARFILALVLVLATVAPSVAVADDVTTVDADNGLTDQSSIDRFEEKGVATADVVAPNMRLTVAEEHEQVGLGGIRLDGDSIYVRVDYNETIARTVRFYIPSEYFYPVTSLDHSAEETDIAADFEPTKTGRYTAVTVHFKGKTSAVFEIKLATTGVFWFRDKTRDVVNNTTGYSPPRLGRDSKWAYVPDGALNGSASYAINSSTGATVQYDSNPVAGKEAWLSVPNCGGTNAPVCLYRKRGVENKVFVLSKAEGAPSVRWKAGADYSAKADAGWTDLKQIPQRVRALLDSLLGGDS